MNKLWVFVFRRFVLSWCGVVLDHGINPPLVRCVPIASTGVWLGRINKNCNARIPIVTVTLSLIWTHHYPFVRIVFRTARLVQDRSTNSEREIARKRG